VPEYIAPLVDKTLAVITALTPELLGELPPFATLGKLFTGAVVNFPGVWVMPVRTAIGDEGTGKIDEVHQVTVKVAVSASDPEELPGLAMAYVKACTLAIEHTSPAEWDAALTGGGVLHVHVSGHNYGVAFERGGTFAMLPDLYVEFEVSELEAQ
jgi:hypothetical protein